MIAEMISVKGIYGVLGTMFPPLVGVMSYLSVFELTNSSLIALGVSAIFSSITAYVTVRPRMVSASSAAQVAERQQAMTEWAALLQQNNVTHAEQIRECREETKDLARRITLIRVSKHNIMDAYSGSCQHITFLESILKDNNLTIPIFTPRTLKEMWGIEDEEMIKIAKNGK